MPADLHCHTGRSDGTVSLEELVALGKAAGLSAVAVTDLTPWRTLPLPDSRQSTAVSP